MLAYNITNHPGQLSLPSLSGR